MKKLVAIVLTLIIAVCACATVAATGGFVSSPSNNQAPTVVGFKTDLDGCPAVIVCTAYADRDELKTETREKLEDAYETIVNTLDLSLLNEDLTDVAKQLGIDVKDLAVSDMFDISAIGCDLHENHGHFEVELKPTSLKNFVALIHYYKGEWRIVEDVEIDEEGNLVFEEDEFSPFAIVVDIGEEESSLLWLWILLAVLATLIIFFVIWKKSKKDTKEA
ncbi:MAG: hypothetical protein E7598_01210 [Ruminococcaceae bacterium]|nr:hypothetical protein [Oscillospiraceae bacterium]